MPKIDRFEDLKCSTPMAKDSVLTPHASVLIARRSVLMTAQSSVLSPRKLNQDGFTFIEIMIVLVIIGILVTLAQPSFTTSVQRAREAALKENLFVMRDVIDQHYADHGEYPPSLEVLIEKRYLRKVPKDPITGTEATWVLVHDKNEDGMEAGIFDIKSGSDQAAMDGTTYNTW